MPDLENVIKGLELCLGSIDSAGCPEECPYYEACQKYENRVVFQPLMRDALEALKAQEQEISRLKHHVDCDAAEKLSSGCVGYGRGFNDDEPCETCKVCEKYNGYGEE